MKRRLIRFLMISMTTLMLCGCGKQYTTEISLDEIVESKDRNETNFDEKDDVEEISIGSSDNEVVADLKHAVKKYLDNYYEANYYTGPCRLLIDESSDEWITEDGELIFSGDYIETRIIFDDIDLDTTNHSATVNCHVSVYDKDSGKKTLDNHSLVFAANANNQEWTIAENGTNENITNNDVDESSDENSENQNVDGSSEMVDDAFRLVIAELQRALNSDDEAMLTSLGFDIEIKWANSLGYAEYDYDGDGINELIIGEDEGTRTFVWAVYEKYQTGDGWNTTVAVSGYARNRYYLMDGNRLLNEWSSGAADSGTDIYKLDSVGGKFLESSVYDDYSSQCIKLTLQPIY